MKRPDFKKILTRDGSRYFCAQDAQNVIDLINYIDYLELSSEVRQAQDIIYEETEK